jgi:hypothetical protein
MTGVGHRAGNELRDRRQALPSATCGAAEPDSCPFAPEPLLPRPGVGHRADSVTDFPQADVTLRAVLEVERSPQ